MKKSICLLLAWLAAGLWPAYALAQEVPSTPDAALYALIHAMARGDTQGMAAATRGEIPIGQYPADPVYNYIVWPSVRIAGDIAQSELPGGGVLLRAPVAYADVDALHAAALSGALPGEDDLYLLESPVFTWGQQLDGTFAPERPALLTQAALAHAMTQEEAEFIAVRESAGWVIDLDATGARRLAAQGARVRVSLPSFGVLEMDAAQQRYAYAYNDAYEWAQDASLARDRLWLRLLCEGGDQRTLETIAFCAPETAPGAQGLSLRAQPVGFSWTDGQSAWVTLRWLAYHRVYLARDPEDATQERDLYDNELFWLTQPGQFAAVLTGHTPDGVYDPAALKQALRGGAPRYAVTYFPYTPFAYRTVQTVDSAHTLYDQGADASAVAVTLQTWRVRSRAARADDDSQAVPCASVREMLAQNCLWAQGVPEAVLAAPATDYVLFQLTGTTQKPPTFGVYDMTFTAAPADGLWVLAAEECGMCASIDRNDVWPEDTQGQVSLCVLARADRPEEELLAAIEGLRVTAAFSAEAVMGPEWHQNTSAIGPRNEAPVRIGALTPAQDGE